MEAAVFALGAACFVLATVLLTLWLRWRRAEKELSLAEEWEQLCARLDVAVGFCDENLTLRRANPAFLGMFVNGKRPLKAGGGGVTTDQWLGKQGAGHPLQEMLLRTLTGNDSARGCVRLDDGETCVVRTRRVNLDNGRLLLSVVADRLRDRAEAGEFTMIAAGQDKAVAPSRDQRRGERRKRERMKDASIIRIAHDLRNPLNAAMGWLHLIETDKVPRDELGSAVRRIHNNILRQNGLIDELRKLAEPMPKVAGASPSPDGSTTG